MRHLFLWIGLFWVRPVEYLCCRLRMKARQHSLFECGPSIRQEEAKLKTVVAHTISLISTISPFFYHHQLSELTRFSK